ncbi:MAG: hypothetical protein KGQ52_09705 [Alphaproteobacteria bacterium]|nr:hypothetical protein [Alphaproteobacteria bacterium]
MELELDTNRQRFVETQLLMCDDDDNICPPWLANNLMRAAIISVEHPDSPPSGLLAAMQQDAMAKFRRRCARESIAALRQLEEQHAQELALFDEKAEAQMAKLEAQLREWRRGLRMGTLTEGAAAIAPEAISIIQRQLERLIASTAERRADLRLAAARKEERLLADFRPRPRARVIATAHWRLRQRRAYVRGNWWDAGEDVLDWLPSHARRTMRKAS